MLNGEWLRWSAVGWRVFIPIWARCDCSSSAFESRLQPPAPVPPIVLETSC